MKRIALFALFTALAHAAIVPVDITWTPGQYEVTYLGKVSAYHNTLYARTLSDPTLLFLFDSASTVGSIASFTMSEEWAMMFQSPEGMFSSVGALSSDGYPHAVQFGKVVTWEDQIGPGFGDYDWPNFPGGPDLTIGDGADFGTENNRIGDAPVPEPLAFFLVGFGVIGLWLMRKAG